MYHFVEVVKLAKILSKSLLVFGIDIRRKLFKQILDAFGGNIRFVINGIIDIINAHALPLAANMLAQLRAFVASDKHGTFQAELRQLRKRTVNEPYTINLYHALGIILGKFLKSLTHSGC